MSDTNYAAEVSEPDVQNAFGVIHIHNQSRTYHLTFRAIHDVKLLESNYNFFYHLIYNSIEVFNDTYESFAYLIYRNPAEQDLYLNVDISALHTIVHYIQTNKLPLSLTHADYNELLDLATIFNMTKLISQLRQNDTRPQIISGELTE